MAYRKHDEAVIEGEAAPAALFDYLDDHERLAAHMAKPSMMMMGGAMTYAFDAAKGRTVGSVIRMCGSFLGHKLSVEEVVIERTPPARKVWETRGAMKLVIIGAYRMGFEITPGAAANAVRVFIDYDYPKSLLGRILGPLLAPIYTRWCVRRMAHDAKAHFASATARSALAH